MTPEPSTTLSYHTPEARRHWQLIDAEPGVVLSVEPPPAWKPMTADALVIACGVFLTGLLAFSIRAAITGTPRIRWGTVTVLGFATVWILSNGWDAAKRLIHVMRHVAGSPTLRLVSKTAAVSDDLAGIPRDETVFVVDEVLEGRGRLLWTGGRDATLVLLLHGSQVQVLPWPWGQGELQALIAAVKERLRL